MRRAQRNTYAQDPYDAYRRPDASYGEGVQEASYGPGGRDPYEEAPYEEAEYPYPGEPPYDQGNNPYEGQPYAEQPYQEEEAGYGEEPPYDDAQPYGQEPVEPEMVSTSQAVNLTCTLAAMSGLFALFLYVADRRSTAVRRICVQSIALAGGFLCASILCWILGTIFRFIPFLGVIIAIIFWLVFAALLLATVFLKIQMMLSAYRGYAYQLPVVGGYVRRFE